MGWFKSVVCGVKWFFGIENGEKNSETVVAASPFVTTKPSHMYFDEDGDLANEFYVEVIPPKGRPWMKRIKKHLTWQGIVQLDKPRLHVDFPVAIYQG